LLGFEPRLSESKSEVLTIAPQRRFIQTNQKHLQNQFKNYYNFNWKDKFWINSKIENRNLLNWICQFQMNQIQFIDLYLILISILNQVSAVNQNPILNLNYTFKIPIEYLKFNSNFESKLFSNPNSKWI
jgi:hypothetical protein